MDAHKLEEQWTTSAIQKQKLPKKIDIVQFLLNSFFPINDLGIPKIGRTQSTASGEEYSFKLQFTL